VNAYNQITNSGFSYDASGNTTADGSYSYTWNGEGMQKMAGSTTYTYDGDGKRVEKSSGTYYWFSPSGSILAETDTGGGTLNEYIYFSGGRIARRDSSGNAYYYFSDHLGTTRTIATASGTVCYDADYTPFGYEMAYTTTCTQNYRFTGFERDGETGNDHTLYRQYEQNLGRWMSPDPVAGDVTNPQSLNRYAYVVNNPASLTDPSGAFFYMCNPDQGSCTWWGSPGAGGGGGAAFTGPLWENEGAAEAQFMASNNLCPGGCGGLTYTQGGLTYIWVPAQEVGIYGILADGNIATITFLFEGYWADAGSVVGNLLIPRQPGSFSIPAWFPQTVQTFKNAGIVPSPIDKYNPFHGTDLNLRDFSPICSAHVTLDTSSGQSPGQPTTGSMHFEAFNPTYNVPVYPLSPEGTQATFTILHGLADVFPWLVGRAIGVNVPNAGSLCQ
jgi:RHS repeat-associated protein